MIDDLDIKDRIMSTTNKMGNLKKFWDNEHVDTYSKYLILRLILMNLLLWGFDTWLFCETLKNKLEFFYSAIQDRY